MWPEFTVVGPVNGACVCWTAGCGDDVLDEFVTVYKCESVFLVNNKLKY